MEITFLGGAEEIGASCAVVDIDRYHRLIVDCGQRIGALPGEQLPDFSFLEDGPAPQAVLVTHAHIDHIGGLPALEPWLPANCPIYASPATIDLAHIMLEDSVKANTLYRGGDDQLPLYPPSTLTPTLQRFEPIRWGAPTKLGEDLKATWYPAGHILGAGMIQIATSQMSVLFSGDISVADQVGVPGAFVPAIQPDMLVLESTYGDRAHVHRPLQEDRLIQRVQAALLEGGSVLFPTFALGRAQEVLLLIGKAMREGKLQEVPVWADGMVRPIANLYAEYGDELSPFCRRLWENGFNAVFPEDLPIQPVTTNAQREQIVHGPPSVVVASGGMLQGGASLNYARTWLSDPKQLIAITGYQDEESPGHALLDLANRDKTEVRKFPFDGVMTEVRCHVERYSLSAHADCSELIAVATKLKPKLILPVHGDDQARVNFADQLKRQWGGEVVLPVLGEAYSVMPRRRSRYVNAPPRRAPPNPLTLWPPWDPYTPRELDLGRFHRWLAGLQPRLWQISRANLAALWKSPHEPSDEDLAEVDIALRQQEQPYFIPDERRPEQLRITPTENLPPTHPPLDWSRTERLAHEYFPAETGLLRIGLYPAEGVVELTFEFPAAIEQQHLTKLQQLTSETGWQWRLTDQSTNEQIERLLARWLSGPHAVQIDHAQRVVSLENSTLTSQEQHRLQAQFQRRTGYELSVRTPDQLHSSEEA